MRLFVRAGLTCPTRSKQYSTSIMSTQIHPRIGVGVFVLRSNHDSNPTEFIMGKRLGSVGAGTLALPGGHLEFGESFEECARREVYEETGLEVQNLRFMTATNDVMEIEQKHYVTIFMIAERVEDQEPKLMEPDKCEGWEWVGWETLKQCAQDQAASIQQRKTTQAGARRLFSPLVALIQQRPHAVPSLR